MLEAIIPLPIQIVIDDVGWWSGENAHQRNEPYRTGINRNHTVADYRAIVELGKRLNVRPQAAMILCEWDKENILKALPSATWMGSHWDNSRWVGPWLEEAGQIIRDNPNHFELTLHGVGHEYWTDEVMSQAEWHDKQSNLRPRDQILAHLEYYVKLLDQHQLGSMPTSFVPCSFLHRFGLDEEGLALILRQHGINFISTPYGYMEKNRDPEYGVFGFDACVMTVDRGWDLIDWKVINPDVKGQLNGPICGMHWPNLLHDDPERNSEVVDRWVKLIEPYGHRLDRMLAPNTECFARQLAHQVVSEVRVEDRKIVLDTRNFFKLPDQSAQSSVTIKVAAERPVRFASDLATVVRHDFNEMERRHRYQLEVQCNADQMPAVPFETTD